METRKVTIINSRTQSQKVITDSRATTLGELKAEMRERGIEYSDMTFFEGHMRAELKDDAAPLPTNIPYKGQVVNDLTFMLTSPEKKVKSGAMKRKEAYDKITELGLQDECKRKYGRNYTQCTTEDLVSLIESKSKPTVKKETKENKNSVEETTNVPVTEFTTMNSNCEKVVTILLEELFNNDCIGEETYDRCSSILKGMPDVKPERMSKREIDEMFNFVKK